MATLESGALAYYDGHGPVGLVPVKVLSVTTTTPNDIRPSSNQTVRARVTVQHGAYKPGDILVGWGLHFLPRECIRRNSFRVGPYVVREDPRGL